MQRWHGLEAVPTGWGRCVVTIGVFDGVHRGHAGIIGTAVALARRARRAERADHVRAAPVRGGPAGHRTRRCSPRSCGAPSWSSSSASTCSARCRSPSSSPSCRRTSSCTCALVERLHAAGVVVGENFRFGHKAAGDVAQLARLGQRFGFTRRRVSVCCADAEGPISATYVRSCVQAGDVTAAAEALGRPHRVDGVVERGDQRGRDLGFPTANLRTEPWAAVPADGVYAGRVVRLDEWGRTLDEPPLGIAAISVGTNPTFEVRQRRVEAYVLDFDGDLYGAALGVEFLARLRGMERFDAVDALVAQMRADVEQTRAALS